MIFRIVFLLFFTHLSLADNITNGTYKEMFENELPKYEITYKNSKKHGKEIFGLILVLKKWKAITSMVLRTDIGGNGIKTGALS